MVSKKERSAIGRALSALRKRVKVECPVCGDTFTGIRKRRYCSDACRQEAYRRRKAAD